MAKESTLLVVDVGNTNIVLGVFQGARLLTSWRFATARERTADEYGILATQLSAAVVTGPFDGGVLCNGPGAPVTTSGWTVDGEPIG